MNSLKERLFAKKSAAPAQEVLPRAERVAVTELPETDATDPVADERRRLFLKGMMVLVAGVFASQFFPKKSEALVMGSTPGTGVVGVKNISNTRINPSALEGNSVSKKTTILTGSGTVHTPASGKKVRVYTSKFSLDTTMTSISFRFTSGGTDFEKYLAPRTGGLYGTNNHPNFIEGGVDLVLYCNIVGTGNVQINIDYLEV